MFDIDIIVTGWPALSKAELLEIHKKSWVAVGKQWRRKFLRGHFTHAGARKYKYALRQGERTPGGHPIPRSYTWRKLRQRGHTRPLEFYGREKARAVANDKVLADTNGLGCDVHLPQGFYRKHPRSKAVMADEIRAVTHDEVQYLQNFWVAELTKRMDRIAKGRTYRIRAWH